MVTAAARPERIEHGAVLGGHGDDVARAAPTLDGQVVGFGGAAGEDDLARRRAGQPGDAPAGLLHRLFGFPAEAVAAAGGVAEPGAEIGQHGLQHARVDRRGGLMVQIDQASACLDIPIVA